MRISDWSSDVCSSDLQEQPVGQRVEIVALCALDIMPLFEHMEHAENLVLRAPHRLRDVGKPHWPRHARQQLQDIEPFLECRGGIGRGLRSEERRVGKACVRTGRSWWWPYH